MIRDFYVPVLTNAVNYDRVCGYFSSTALSLASRGFSKFCQNPGAKMRLIVGAKLFTHDAEIIFEKQISKPNTEIISNRLNEELNKALKAPDFEQDRLKGLAWMLENKILEVKVGIMVDNYGKVLSHSEAEFHHKYGIIKDSNDKSTNIVHFIGSINESKRSWLMNGDSINVHRSWIPGHMEFIDSAIQEFNTLWNINGIDRKLGAAIVSLPQAVKNHWIDYFRPKSPVKIGEPHYIVPRKYHNNFKKEKNDKNLWIHQDEAVKWFLNPYGVNGIGILMMATGTGKTRTALKITQKMFDNNTIDAVIINASERLLHQWDKEMSKEHISWRKYNYWHTANLKQYDEFSINNKPGRCLMITYSFLPEFLSTIKQNDLTRTLLIVDEVHNIGSEQNISKMKINNLDEKYISESNYYSLAKGDYEKLSNKYNKVKYRLGLSATPFSEFDADRNQFISDSFIKDKFDINSNLDWKTKILTEKLVFNFNLKKSIENGILCPFDYIPLEYVPYLNELEERKRVMRVWSAKVKEGEASPEAPYIMAANVLKSSRAKLPVFEEYLIKNYKEILKRCIIFVQTTEFGKEVCRIINKYTHNYHEFFSDDEKQNLIDFGNGELEVLITCHMISEGIDIKSISNIILFSSDRQKLEAIQRIGRALRIDPSNPEKRAKVIDLVYLEEDKIDSSDKIRMEWLLDLSKISS